MITRMVNKSSINVCTGCTVLFEYYRQAIHIKFQITVQLNIIATV